MGGVPLLYEVHSSVIRCPTQSVAVLEGDKRVKLIIIKAGWLFLGYTEWDPLVRISEEVKVSEEQTEKVQERNTFVFLAVFLAPALAVAIVGGYGFAVWISQLILGPPGSVL